MPRSLPRADGFQRDRLPVSPTTALTGWRWRIALDAEWFRETFGEPTYPQLHGWQAISEGHHTLIVAPTGSGKTLAAFLAEELMVSVKTKRVYNPKAPGDGMRVLVMRLWPRGIKKSHVDRWLKELGAEIPLIRAWKSGTLTSWPEFRRRYLAGLKKPVARAQIRELKALAKKGRVTLLCACPDESRCHRGVLKRLLA